MISDRSLKILLRSDRLVGMVGDIVRVACFIAAAGIIVLWLVYYFATGRMMITRMQMNDFGRFYYSAQLFLQGGDMYGVSPATPVYVAPGVYHPFWNMNPPHFHLPLLPLAVTPPGTALFIWALASALTLAWSLVLIGRELRIRLTATGALWGCVAALAFAATGAVIVTGQMSLLLMLPVTLAWLAARRGEWTRAGVWLGLGMSVKPFLLFFLPYLVLRRRWRAATAALVTVAGAFAAGLAVFGPASYRAWIQALQSTDWTWAAMNGSLLGVLSRTLGDSPYFTPLASAPAIVPSVWLAAAVAAALVTLAAVWRDETKEAVDRGFLLVLVGAQLVSPLGWIYYFWLPIGPAAALVLSWIRQRREHPEEVGVAPWRNRLAWASLPFLAWPLSLMTLRQPSALATLTIGSAYFWGTLLIWAAVLVDGFQATRRETLGSAVSKPPGR
jgi:alpha-1,2-mannosyltransferase